MKHLGRILAILLAGALFAAVIFEEEAPDTGQRPSVCIRSAQADRQEDGTYQVRVAFTAYGALDQRAELSVWIFCGEESQHLPLTEKTAGEVQCLDFMLKEQPEEVRAVIGCGEYVPLLVDASAPVDGDRILLLQQVPPGAVYEIRLMAELWEVLSCPHSLSPDPEVATIPPESPGSTLTAGPEGTAVLNLTQAGLPDGLYLLTGKGTMQYVCLPQVDASGALLASTVTVYGNQRK